MSDNHPMLNKLVKSLEDVQAFDITVLDVRDQTTITDYMIICSGRSSRHVKSIADRIMDDLKLAGMPSLSHHGLDSGEWALVDFGYFVVHVMQPESRSFYNIEGLWQ